MNVLLDTHVVVWAFSEPTRIPLRIRELLDTKVELAWVSHLSLWEIGMKYPLKRRDSPVRSASQTLADAVEAGFRLLPLDISHILAFEHLPRLHGDPIDRLLVAQALTENLRLLTHDSRLAAYSDTVIAW
jgi:PIN domain nuclease of toxin-antitoxin system